MERPNFEQIRSGTTRAGRALGSTAMRFATTARVKIPEAIERAQHNADHPRLQQIADNPLVNRIAAGIRPETDQPS